MELKDFVKNTLLSIHDGMKEAGKNPGGSDKFVIDTYGETDSKFIHFDVAVTTSTEKSGKVKGEGKIFIAGVSAGGEAKHTSENVSRVKFKVHYNC